MNNKLKKNALKTAVIVLSAIILVLTVLYVSNTYHGETTGNIMSTSVTVPEGYNYYTKSHIVFTDCKNNRTTKSNVAHSLQSENPDISNAMTVIPKGEHFNNPSFSVRIVVNTVYCGTDYLYMNWNEYHSAVKSLSGGEYFFEEYNTAETSWVRYAAFVPEGMPYTKVLTSVVNGKQIYIIASSKNEPMSSSEENALYEIANSLHP